MISDAHYEAKILLSRGAVRFFLISALSFILRYGSITLCAVGLVYVFKSSSFSILVNTWGVYLSYGLFVAISIITAVTTLCFACAVRLGEEFCYFTKANNGNGKFTLLFKFLKPETSLKALFLYSRVFILKSMWLIYFLVPCGACVLCGYYLYNSPAFNSIFYYILCAGASLICSASLMLWRICVFRYSAAPYYLCLRPEKSPHSTLRKSIFFTDAFSIEGVLTEFSLTFRVLSCFFIIPAIFAIPHIKLTKAVFVTLCVSSTAKTKTSCAVNYLKLCQHID